MRFQVPGSAPATLIVGGTIGIVPVNNSTVLDAGSPIVTVSGSTMVLGPYDTSTLQSVAAQFMATPNAADIFNQILTVAFVWAGVGTRTYQCMGELDVNVPVLSDSLEVEITQTSGHNMTVDPTITGNQRAVPAEYLVNICTPPTFFGSQLPADTDVDGDGTGRYIAWAGTINPGENANQPIPSIAGPAQLTFIYAGATPLTISLRVVDLWWVDNGSGSFSANPISGGYSADSVSQAVTGFPFVAPPRALGVEIFNHDLTHTLTFQLSVTFDGP